jgi:hypothetical protein
MYFGNALDREYSACCTLLQEKFISLSTIYYRQQNSNVRLLIDDETPRARNRLLMHRSLAR